MARARSPSYPAIGLKEAIDKVKMVYAKDFQNKVAKAVIANHMGYKGLNGGSLPVLAALNQYGLLDGRGEDTFVSDRALKIIAHEPGVVERLTAIRDAATAPELFAELHSRFPDGKASDVAIRSYLLISKFIPAAADTAIRSYRETFDLFNAEEGAYSRDQKAEFDAGFDHHAGESMEATNVHHVASRREEETQRVNQRREIITLDEGDVVITFPEYLSSDSFGDLKDHLDLFVKKMQRRAGQDKAN